MVTRIHNVALKYARREVIIQIREKQKKTFTLHHNLCIFIFKGVEKHCGGGKEAGTLRQVRKTNGSTAF